MASTNSIQSSASSGLTMLTSGVNQYLHPDYLQPMPITLDAKKSPLAMLAQTCSSIGKDSAPSKSIIPPLEKSNKNTDKPYDRNGHTGSPSSGNSRRPNSRGSKESTTARDLSSMSKYEFKSFHSSEASSPLSMPVNGDKNNNHGSSQPKPATSPLMNGGATCLTIPQTSSNRPSSASTVPRASSRCSSAGKSESYEQCNRTYRNVSQSQNTVSSSGSSHLPSQHRQSSSSHHLHRESPSSSSSASVRSSSSSPIYSKPSASSHSNSISQVSPLAGSTASSSSSAIKPHVTPLPSHPSMLGSMPVPPHLVGYPNPFSLLGHGLDAASYHSAALAAHTSLSNYSAAAAAAAAAQSSAALKAAAANSVAGMSPYVTYVRVRTPSGGTTLVPVCRDPYCATCQLTMQNSHIAASCSTPGCAQCAHEKSLTSLSALGAGIPSASSMLGLPPFQPPTSNIAGISSLHSLYPHSALASSAAQQGQQYVCDFVVGSDYCGKRFHSSEEFLQHLRTHTSGLDMNALAASYAGLGAGLPSAAALSAYHHLPPSLSPNSLSRAYNSPVSSLLAASRYHPYKSPLSGMTAPPSQPLPPVGPYYPPYNLYGQRLGAAAVP